MTAFVRNIEFELVTRSFYEIVSECLIKPASAARKAVICRYSQRNLGLTRSWHARSPARIQRAACPPPA